MEAIEKKSFGSLVDELITTSMKCWHAQERIMAGGTDEQVAAAAKNAQQLNARRNALIRAIDGRQGDGATTQTGKTYA
jgi:hypothetical protein